MAFTDPLIGKRLGDYLIESVLGTGGMARVYRGYDDNLDRYAAIKVIEPQLIASAEEDEYRERFLREARAIARLNHNRIVSVYQFNQIGNLYYIAMEYIEGKNLRDVLKSYLKQGRVLPTEELLVVLRDIADALDYAHKQSIIHRDIKPSNIIITPDGNAVLTDFGLALNAVEGTIGNTFGSVHYIAPEQAISSAQAVPASDQYSLGIVAYELVTGRVPFDDASAMSVALKHISDPPPPPTEINPNIPVEVEQVILRALDKEPNRRFENAREFVRNLEVAFEMSKTGDIAAPKAIVEAIGAPPATNPVPPPSRVSQEDKVKTTNAQIVIDEDSIGKKANTSSVPLTSDGRAGWAVAALLVVLIAIIGGYVLFSQIQTNNATASSTAEAISARGTANESTAIALAERQTSEAQTEIAEATGSAEALMARNTADAQATSVQATDDAATEIQRTENALATEAQQTSVAATAEAEASRSTATAQAEETRLAATAEAATNAANTEQAAIQASETRQALSVSPTATNTVEFTPTFTASPTMTPSVTPMPSATPTPALLIAEETDTAQVMLRYDGRMLILGNRDRENSIDVSDLVFVQVAPDDNGIFREAITFTIARTDLASTAQNLAEERCLEILDSNQFSSLPSQNPLTTGLCNGTPFWVTTTSPFWINDNPQAYFEVRLGAVDVLTRCPVQRALTRAELRCAIDINAIP